MRETTSAVAAVLNEAQRLVEAAPPDIDHGQDDLWWIDRAADRMAAPDHVRKAGRDAYRAALGLHKALGRPTARPRRTRYRGRG